MFIEDVNPAFHDGRRSGQAELLLGQGLNGQAVAVPAKSPFDIASAHGLVAWNDVLNRPGQQVAIMRQASGKWRAVVKYVRWRVLAPFQGLGENVVLFPKFQDFFFQLGK